MNQMLHAPLSITSSGAIARQALAQAQDATVWGTTSRGIFLHLSTDWMIFLSFDPFRGPLTLNSDLGSNIFQDLRPGMIVRVSNRTLHFDTLGIEILIGGSVLWSAPARNAASPTSLTGRFNRIEYIDQKVLNARESNLSYDLLADRLIAANREKSLVFPVDNSHDISRISARLEKGLGLGEGLTPAGDDLALGYLLAINRWGDLLSPDLNVPEINQTIRQAAYRKTNTLSANLIECATLGQADERLISALDGILTGEPDPDTCITHLLSWGHTSGANALVGMAMALM